MDYWQKPVTVMGLGHFGGGAAAARWLVQRGARVTLTDIATAAELEVPLRSMCDVDFAAVHLGGHHREDFQNAELIVVNPAVRPDNGFLAIAREGGARLTTEIELFMRNCPARIVGVTGSNGKSTTAAMIAAVLRADGRPAWLGGNIGVSLLPELSKMTANDIVVLELSSFQLYYLDSETRMPQVAVVTNFSPNHLNWHGTINHYRKAKQRIIARQSASDVAVLDMSLLESADWTGCAVGQVLPPADTSELPPLRIPGQHNRRNSVLAMAACRVLGCEEVAIQRGLSQFTTLPGRIERVTDIDGRTFYNDTTSTTPESTVAALQSFDSAAGGTWLLAGGSDKGVDFDEMAAAIAKHARGAAFFGETAQKMLQKTAKKSPQLPATALNSLSEALEWCLEHSSAGDRIVLSPGCASLDQFQNFRTRGERFVSLVDKLRLSH